MLDIDAYSADSNDSFFPKQSRSDEDKADLSFSTSLSIINKLSSLRQNVPGATGHDKLAELFRKDLISAMKLADSDVLRRDDYVMISDHWRQDWEKGVQVPVKPDALKHGLARLIKENEKLHGPYAFKMPKKLLHAVADETYKQGMHELHETQKMADEVCRYDLDDVDCIWLSSYNELRKDHGDVQLTEYEMERVMEQLETRCYDGLKDAMKTTEGVGIEYDEDVVCDICRSPEGEDGNEMIFCDVCDICVHQACYGVTKIPSGSWLCRPCAVGIKPSCVLCPNAGGAMKSTRDGMRWCHLSCALWIPEITIADTEKMEPIANISDIPANRWSLICSLCRERNGACIQCSVPKCKTAFHVTCAFLHNLDMKANFDAETELVMKGFCAKHSKKLEADGTPRKATSSTPKKHAEMTEEEKKAAKARKLEKLAEVFYSYVGDLQPVAAALELDVDTVNVIYNYWLLKRKCHFNKQLMTPKVEEGDLLLKQNEDGMIARLKMFIQLRQDLERVRNLCYMVTKREKMRNRLYESKRDVFLHQAAILRSQTGRKLNARDYQSVVNAHHQCTSVYDFPEAIVRTARIAESTASGNDESDFPLSESIAVAAKVKRPKMVGRPRAKGQRPGQPAVTSAVAVKPRKRMPSTENPYARPTYRSFEWLLPRRRMSTEADGETPVVERKKRKRKRELFADQTSSSVGEVSVIVDSEQPNCSSIDLGVNRLFVDVSEIDAEPSVANSSPSPDSPKSKVRRIDDDSDSPNLSLSLRDKRPVSANFADTGGDDSQSATVGHLREPSSSTPLKRSPLHPSTDSPVCNHTTDTAAPQSATKSEARHFSDILVSRTSPGSNARPRAVSPLDDDAYIDVVSDGPVLPSTSTTSLGSQRSVRNGFADGLVRLSKIKAKKLANVNGLRQRTLDSFVRRVPNENVISNGIDGAVGSISKPSADTQDLHRGSPLFCLRLEPDEGSPKKTVSSERTENGGGDNVVDLDSIEGVWRRRTSLRSSAAIINSLGPDLANLA